MKDKKLMPLNLISEIKVALKDIHNKFNVDESNPEIMYRLTEKDDPGSPFFFHIINVETKKGINWYNIEYFPSNPAHVLSKVITVNSSSLRGRIDLWIEFVDKYIKEIQDSDGKKTKESSNKTYGKFKILNPDADADLVPFDDERQKALLNVYDLLLEGLERDRNEENSDYADIIANEVEAAKNSAPVETKNETTDRLNKILDKLNEYGFRVALWAAEKCLEQGAWYLLLN